MTPDERLIARLLAGAAGALALFVIVSLVAITATGDASPAVHAAPTSTTTTTTVPLTPEEQAHRDRKILNAEIRAEIEENNRKLGQSEYGDYGRDRSSLRDCPTYLSPAEQLFCELASADTAPPPSSTGYPVVCRDGWISPSGGKQGACSHHGGVAP